MGCLPFFRLEVDPGADPKPLAQPGQGVTSEVPQVCLKLWFGAPKRKAGVNQLSAHHTSIPGEAPD